MPKSICSAVSGFLSRFDSRPDHEAPSSPGSSIRPPPSIPCVSSTLSPGLFPDNERNRIGPLTLQERVYETAKEAWAKREEDGDSGLCEFTKCASQLSGACDLGVPLLTEGSPMNDKNTELLVARIISEHSSCPPRSVARRWFTETNDFTRRITDRWDAIDKAAADQETEMSKAGTEVTSS